MEERRSNEAYAVQHDDEEPSTTDSPIVTEPTAPVQTPDSNRMRTRCHLRVAKTISAGTNTLRIVVWGKQSRAFDTSDDVIASSSGWFPIFDTEDLSESVDIYRAWLLAGAQDYDYLYPEIVTNGGTTPKCTTYLAFAGVE